MKIAGIPTTKYQCFVLSWKVRIPIMQPTLPPITAVRKNVDSRTRQRFLTALRLSMPIMAKPVRLMTAR